MPASLMVAVVQERRMQQAMHYVREHGAMTNTVYRDLTGVSEATARRDLEALVERGALRRARSLARNRQDAGTALPVAVGLEVARARCSAHVTLSPEGGGE